MLNIARTILVCLLLSCSSAALAKDAACPPGAPYIGPALLPTPKVPSLPAQAAALGQPMHVEVSARLDAVFDQTFSLVDAPSGGAALWHPTLGSWSRTAGATKDARFWWASVAKLVTASILLQLVDERRLSLDAPVARWFPEYPQAERMTIDQLLTHTSGAFSFNADKKLRRERGYHPPEKLLRVAARHGSDFCPGSTWNYSNTGYLMLALIAERIEAKPWAAIVEQRIAAPLGLASLRVLSPGDAPDSIAPPDDDPRSTLAELASLRGVGALAAEPKDMLAVLHAYLRGTLVPESARKAALERLYPMFGDPMGYGRGVMAVDVPDADMPTTWIGHLGGAPGGKALLVYDIKRRACVALALTKDAPAAAGMVNALLKATDVHAAP